LTLDSLDIFPAIDIRQGRVVRLSQGETARQTVYGDDPAAVAERFADEGASWIHVVDLDRALGEGDNEPAVRRLAGRVQGRVQIQLGGGFRTLDRIVAGLALGVRRLVIGTAAATDPGFVDTAAATVAPDRLAVGVDARDGLVAVRGWTETSTVRAEELVRRVVAQGIDTVIYTDVSRDGMLAGADLAGAAALQRLGARVIASGGIASSDDVRAARDLGLAGVVIGRAIYEGRVRLPEALALAGRSPTA
jgi:phosphoribosylformimino-5-aminoimidazole carboxamide ribotide isomerase